MHSVAKWDQQHFLRHFLLMSSCLISNWATFSDWMFFCICLIRKQDGSDAQISATLEPQLFQPTLPYTTSPFHKVGGEQGGGVAALWPLTLFDGRLCDLSFCDVCVNAHLVSTPASVRKHFLCALYLTSNESWLYQSQTFDLQHYFDFYSCLLLFNLCN